jgi:hypothetical protein
MIPNWTWNVVYLKEFKTYVTPSSSGFYWAPAIQGPWTLAGGPTVNLTFAGAIPGAGYTVVSTNPPHIKLTVGSDSHGVHASQGTPIFSQWDVVLGRVPMLMGGENPRYSNVSGVSAYAGYTFSDSHAPGTLPRKDLAWAFDFYDHGGNVSAGISGFHEIGTGSAYLIPCQQAGCGMFAPSQGSSLQTFGAGIWDQGYLAYLTSVMHDAPQTIAIGTANSATGGYTLQNAPAAMQGNGTFTVAGVFRRDGGSGTYDTVPLWYTGSGASTSVGLQYHAQDGSALELGWGGAWDSRWRYLSAFTLPAGNWYFIACTVQANGATPIAHMWTGVGGSLVDEIAGISRTASGGSPTQTPNVSATPLSLGGGNGNSHTVEASYAGLFVYGRALGQAEVGLMYRTVKAKMAARGVTLQ